MRRMTWKMEGRQKRDTIEKKSKYSRLVSITSDGQHGGATEEDRAKERARHTWNNENKTVHLIRI